MKHLSEEGLRKLLYLFMGWEEENIPQSWKEAIIIPIRKPTNCRPFALTSNVCKLMERMVKERLTYYLEKRNLVAWYQSGFRRERDNMDPVLCL